MKQASDLAEAMKTAATSYSTRDLLSVRYMNHFNTLFGFLQSHFLESHWFTHRRTAFSPLHGSCQHSTHCFQQCGRFPSWQCSSGIRCPEWCLSEYFMVSPVDSVFRYAGISASQKTNLGSRKHNRSMDAEK